MKNILLLLLSVTMICAQTVSTPQQFVNAIGSDRTITFDAGRFVVSDPLDEPGEKVRYDKCYDGTELVIEGVSNLTIKGSGDQETHLIAKPSYGYVLVFRHCENITISNIKAGHGDKKGYCTGGVIKFENCSNVKVDSSYLYGCGTDGITIEGSRKVHIDETTIAECSYYITNISKSMDVRYTNCLLKDNSEFDQVVIGQSRRISFENCTFEANRTGLSYPSVDDEALFVVSKDSDKLLLKGCHFLNNSTAHFASSRSVLLMEQCSFEGNSFKLGKYEDEAKK